MLPKVGYWVEHGGRELVCSKAQPVVQSFLRIRGGKMGGGYVRPGLWQQDMAVLHAVAVQLLRRQPASNSMQQAGTTSLTGKKVPDMARVDDSCCMLAGTR